MRMFRSWGLALSACLALIFTSVSYAAEPLVSYIQPAWMDAASEAKFENELALQASLPQATLAATQSGLVRDSHGYMQYSASEALLSLTT
jgi:hypothetical protein